MEAACLLASEPPPFGRPFWGQLPLSAGSGSTLFTPNDKLGSLKLQYSPSRAEQIQSSARVEPIGVERRQTTEEDTRSQANGGWRNLETKTVSLQPGQVAKLALLCSALTLPQSCPKATQRPFAKRERALLVKKKTAFILLQKLV